MQLPIKESPLYVLLSVEETRRWDLDENFRVATISCASSQMLSSGHPHYEIHGTTLEHGVRHLIFRFDRPEFNPALANIMKEVG